jgi:hypothetical protein
MVKMSRDMLESREDIASLSRVSRPEAQFVDEIISFICG